MTRHTAARLPLHGAIAAGWTVLAAIGMAGIASTSATTSPGQATTQTVLAANTSASLTTAVTAPVAPVAESTPAGVARNSSAVTTAAPADRAVVALRAALAEIGLPYVWGGDGPTHGDAGFDCSGLTQFAYATAGITLPRTAHTQFYAGPHVPTGAPLQPGDLVFYGTPSRVHHVGLYVGGGRMVNAPTFGEPVQVAYYRWLGDDYVGATRPDPSSIVNLDALPFIPEASAPAPAAARPGSSDVFVAPRASLPAPLPVLGTIAVPEAQSAAAAISEEHQAGLAPLAAVPTPTGQEATTSGLAPSGQTASSDPVGGALRSVVGTPAGTSPAAAPPASASAPPTGPAVPPTAPPAVPPTVPSLTVATTTVPPTAPPTVAAAVTTSGGPPAPVAPAAAAVPARAAPVVPAAPITHAVPAPKTAPAPKKAPVVKKTPTVKAAATKTTTAAAPATAASSDPAEMTAAKTAAPAPAATEPDSTSAVTTTPKPTTTPDS